MHRKRVANPKDKPTPPQPIVVSPPKIEVLEDATFSDDGDTVNELVVQRVKIPLKKFKGFRDGFRLFVRPDESHDEPNARFDEHEPEDENALKQLFATYGKGCGTVLSIRLEVAPDGRQDFYLDVRHPKPDDDPDAKFPMIFASSDNACADIVADLMYEISGKDPPDSFTMRGDLEDLIDEIKADAEELAPIKDLLSEFDMPGDLPAHLYLLSDRLRSIFRRAKGLS